MMACLIAIRGPEEAHAALIQVAHAAVGVYAVTEHDTRIYKLCYSTLEFCAFNWVWNLG